ncbi:hypothetical protein Q455_0203610 [Escherichia coli ATCC BAA-2192]|nr:hypothetical protein Q455_0203610 [Escherichia coli ATCC BAA-2192]
MFSHIPGWLNAMLCKMLHQTLSHIRKVLIVTNFQQ